MELAEILHSTSNKKDCRNSYAVVTKADCRGLPVLLVFVMANLFKLSMVQMGHCDTSAIDSHLYTLESCQVSRPFLATMIFWSHLPTMHIVMSTRKDKHLWWVYIYFHKTGNWDKLWRVYMFIIHLQYILIHYKYIYNTFIIVFPSTIV